MTFVIFWVVRRLVWGWVASMGVNHFPPLIFDLVALPLIPLYAPPSAESKSIQTSLQPLIYLVHHGPQASRQTSIGGKVSSPG